MKLTENYTLFVSKLVVLAIQFMFLDSFSQTLPNDFEAMKGTRYMHPISDYTDSLSAQKIVELRDKEGIPIWFSRDILKNVCLVGECRMVKLRIYWNGVGNFLGFQVPPNFPLTKTDHFKFRLEDYQKLNWILSDSLSILKSLKLKDLTVEKNEGKSMNQIDAHSGATQPSIYEYVVRNAVYTCYTLWHTVYGPTRENILAILERRTSTNYLQKLFREKNPQYQMYAIDFVRKHPEYHSDFYPTIINMVKSTDNNLAQKAISYFTSWSLNDFTIQEEIARVASEVASLNKFAIIWKFLTLTKVNNKAILIFLEQFENRKINVGQLGYVCKLIHSDNLENPRIVKKLKMLSKDKNLYVRNMAVRVLSNSYK